MKTKQRGSCAHVGYLALAMAGAGCVAAADDGASMEPPEVEMTAKLVHTVDQGNGHTFEFYDMGEGQIGVREEYDLGDKGLLAALPIGEYSLADLYRHVRPSDPIPAAILGADAHAADILSRPQKIYAAVPQAAASQKPTADPGVEVARSAVTGCSADLFGDNWGAQWFVANFCSDLGYTCDTFFPQLRHVENVTAWDWSRGGGSKWLYRQFEGDFNIAGGMKIYRVGFGLPTAIVAFTGPVNPRKLVDFRVTGGWSNQTNYATGSSPCGHDDNVVVWCGSP